HEGELQADFGRLECDCARTWPAQSIRILPQDLWLAAATAHLVRIRLGFDGFNGFSVLAILDGISRHQQAPRGYYQHAVQQCTWETAVTWSSGPLSEIGG